MRSPPYGHSEARLFYQSSGTGQRLVRRCSIVMLAVLVATTHVSVVAVKNHDAHGGGGGGGGGGGDDNNNNNDDDFTFQRGSMVEGRVLLPSYTAGRAIAYPLNSPPPQPPPPPAQPRGSQSRQVQLQQRRSSSSSGQQTRGRSSGVSAPVSPVAAAAARRRHCKRTYCTGDLDNPTVNEVVDRHWVNISLFNQRGRKPPPIEPGSVSSTLESRQIAGAQAAGDACKSNVFTIQPTSARLADSDRSLPILNTATFEQYEQIEVCLSEGGSCSMVHTEHNYQAICRQVYSRRRFLALDEDTGQPVLETFLLEAGCSCYVNQTA